MHSLSWLASCDWTLPTRITVPRSSRSRPSCRVLISAIIGLTPGHRSRVKSTLTCTNLSVLSKSPENDRLNLCAIGEWDERVRKILSSADSAARSSRRRKIRGHLKSTLTSWGTDDSKCNELQRSIYDGFQISNATERSSKIYNNVIVLDADNWRVRAVTILGKKVKVI